MVRLLMPLCAFALVFATASSAASFVSPTSWTRGDGGTTYQAWDVFASTTGAAPDAASINGNGTASLTETSGSSFLISGSGNIYNASAASSFTVTVPEADVPTPAHDVTAIVQIMSLGSALDLTSVTLNGQAAVDYVELDRVALGGFGGDAVSHWFLFNIAYADFGDGIAGVEDLTLSFDATGPHLSLDQLSVDTAIRPFGFYAEPTPVPEPGSLALLGLAAAALIRRRRSASHRSTRFMGRCA